MSDPSGCITYKPAALEVYAQHANLPHNDRICGTQKTADYSSNIHFFSPPLNVFASCVLNDAEMFASLSICSFHQGEKDGAQ